MTGGDYGEGGGKPPDINATNHSDINMLDLNPNNDGNGNGNRSQDNEKILSDRLSNINFDNRYKNDSKGPFSIFVEHKYLNFGKLHPMRISEKLYNLGGEEKNISYLEIVGRNRVQVFCKTPQAANVLVSNPIFDQNNLVAYVPSHLTEKKGLIRGVDTSFSEDDLQKIIQSDINIKAVKRRYKTIKDKDGKLIKVPKQQVLITFDKLELPQYVYIYKLRHEVEIWYSPVSQCFKCLNFGHTSKQCKSKKRCKKCSCILPNDKDSCDDCGEFCMHCKTDSHSSTSKNCPTFSKQKKIKEAMANMNISFKEAEKIVERPSYSSLVLKNKYTPLLSSPTEFPELPIGKKPEYKNTRSDSQKTYTSLSQPTTSKEYNFHKKRKVQDRSPNFSRPCREFDWSYSGSPLIQGPSSLNEESLNEVKTKIKNNLAQKISHSIKPLVRPNLVNVFENINIGDIIDTIVTDTFKQWEQTNKK